MAINDLKSYIMKSSFTLFLFTFFSFFVFSQKQTNLSVFVNSPANNTSVNDGQTFALSLGIVNKGTTLINPSDTLYLFETIDGNPVLGGNNTSYVRFITNVTINPGDTLYNNTTNSFNFNGYTVTSTVCYSIYAANSFNLISETDSTDNTSCIDFIINDNTNGLNSAIMESAIQLYPNPSSNFITISQKSDSHEIMLFDELGKRVTILNEYGDNTYDVSGVPAGFYFVRFEITGKQVNLPLIIQR